MRKILQTFLTVLLTTIFSCYVRAEIKLPAVFSDNMVLQQQSQVAVWGWAKANSNVTVVCSWNKKSYSAKSDGKGYWKLKVETPQASYTPHTLTISDGKPVSLKNVLIGEVWVCSGQSNMEMTMKGYHNQPVENSSEVIENSFNRGIRCFTVEKSSKAKPQDNCTGTWEIANALTVPNFTATGYFFGRLLNQTLDVPVGLIHTSWGGSSIEAWMAPESFKTTISDTQKDSITIELLKKISERTIPAHDTLIKWQNSSPTVLYNGMLKPVAGYGIRGAIWYQGESNKDEPELYAILFDRMVRAWRDVWGVGEFPFYYCQIAPYNYGGGRNSAYIRETQAKGMLIPNTGMAVLMDANSPDCIHPPKKKDAGERLALWALAKTYGMEKIHYRSPEVKSVDIEGQIVIISFDLFGSSSGLTTKGKEILNFKVAGENKRFREAKAALVGNKVYVFSPNVSKPVAVRYCFDNTSASEIFTVEGNLPVSSFRTDEW
ncbi:MAG: sialate O-acetylesterase [Prevotellaceae bacterium]|jgi:sialate O-acetylesterase|nr:sialate O-acetylesterase [Prevotellaceae bacterium]